MIINGYAYPSISIETLDWWLKRLTWLSSFSYGVRADGSLIGLDDEKIIERADMAGVRPMMVLAPMNDEGMFSTDIAVSVFNSPEATENLISNIYSTILEKDLGGIDFDFEYIPGEYAKSYVSLVRETRNRISPLGYLTTVALAPKTMDDQKGTLYEGHDYQAMGQAADYCLIMTYEWGYAYGEPMAVSPVKNVHRVVEYAVSRIPANKILLGINNYGYDWELPFIKGNRAQTLNLKQAVERAGQYGVQIAFDDEAKAPFFEYVNQEGKNHIVWFENERSWNGRIALVEEYGLAGIGIWNIMETFPGVAPEII